MGSSKIWITSRFAGLHRWLGAPDEVGFLRSSHRHEFHVKVTFLVEHNDRQLEFFLQKEKLKNCLDNFPEDLGEMSCEMIAEKILSDLDACEVNVSEDGENGAIYTNY